MAGISPDRGRLSGQKSLPPITPFRDAEVVLAAVMKIEPRTLGRDRLDRDFVAEGLQATDEALLDRGPVSFIEVLRAQVGIARLAGQHVVGDHENRMADGDRRFLLAAAGKEAPILRAEVSGLTAPDRVGRFDQGGAQPLAPLAGLAT